MPAKFKFDFVDPLSRTMIFLCIDQTYSIAESEKKSGGINPPGELVKWHVPKNAN